MGFSAFASADVAPADDSGKVIVQKMIVSVEGRPDLEFDLTEGRHKLQDRQLLFKEGAEFRVKLIFNVQNEIASGLKYHHVMSRKGITVDKQSYMVGSYAPKRESHAYVSPVDEAPKGMLSRGHYKIKSRLIDDDKNVHLVWEWSMDIQKNWK